MKKLVCLVLVLALTGCAAPNPAVVVPSATPTPAAAGITVEVVHCDPNVDLEGAAKLYMEGHSGVDVRVTLADDYDDIIGLLDDPGGPAIFAVEADDIDSVLGHASALTGEALIAGLNDSAIDEVTRDAHIYAMPSSVRGFGLAYNRDIFEAAGVDAGITDFEGLKTALETLHSKIADGALKDGFPELDRVCAVNEDDHVLGDMLLNAALIPEFASSGGVRDAAQLTWQYGDSLKAILDLLAKYSKEGDEAEHMEADEAVDELLNGRIALFPVDTGIKSAAEDKLGLLPLPIKDVAEDTILTYTPYYWCVNADKVELVRQAALDFLTWLYCTEDGMSAAVNTVGYILPFETTVSRLEEDPLYSATLAYMEDGLAQESVTAGLPHGFEEYAADYLGDYLDGEAEWEQALSEIDRVFRGLKRYGAQL